MNETFHNFDMDKFIKALIALLGEQEGVEIKYTLKKKKEANTA